MESNMQYSRIQGEKLYLLKIAKESYFGLWYEAFQM